MDSVNPAPAGNPQLTTHLLVSHKKNKNFHPSKVSLKRIKFLVKQIPLPKGLAPQVQISLRPQSAKMSWVRQRHQLKLADILLWLDKEDCLMWHPPNILKHPCTIHLKIECKIPVTKEECWQFKPVVFLLRLLDWDDSEMFQSTEKDENVHLLSSRSEEHTSEL